jgi:hypothetical protein
MGGEGRGYNYRSFPEAAMFYTLGNLLNSTRGTNVCTSILHYNTRISFIATYLKIL